MLARLPLHEALLIVAIAAAGFALWTILFYQRKKSPSFVQPGHFITEATRHNSELWRVADRLMTCQLHGRLGNMMFAYAALIGIAQKTGRTPVLPINHFLRSMFHIRAAALPHRLSGTEKLFESHGAGAYDSQFEQFHSDIQLLELVGYFQSWKYFRNMEPLIREEFTFRRHVTAAVDKFLQSAVKENYGPDAHTYDVILIGVHIRVGDMMLDANIARGYTVASLHYFTAAVEWFQHRFPREQLLFVLATDDRKWCRDNFPYMSLGKLPVVNTALGPDVQDLAILAACNHTIITVGSFGWWAAWLSGGITVYYHNFPRFNSSLAREYVLDDYYPDSWIAM